MTVLLVLAYGIEPDLYHGVGEDFNSGITTSSRGVGQYGYPSDPMSDRAKGYLLKGNSKENLEIIIYKGFSSSTTHQIEVDLEKKVIDFDHHFTNFKLYRAPLSIGSEEIIRERKNSLFFLDKKNWK